MGVRIFPGTCSQGDPDDAEGRSYVQQGSHAEFRTPANAEDDADSPGPPPAQDTDQSDGGDAQESEGESDTSDG
jgi:hypothetical protein